MTDDPKARRREYLRNYKRAQREDARLNAMCIICITRPAKPGTVTCVECVTRGVEYERKNGWRKKG